MRVRYLVLILVLFALALPPAPAHAAAYLTVCDEAHLLSALGAGTVIIQCSGTINLPNTIAVSSNKELDATGQSVTLNGNYLVQIFNVWAGRSLDLTSITIANGYASEYGGAIYNAGTLYTSGVRFTGNYAALGGGAIENRGSAAINSTTFTGNRTGADGGAIRNARGSLNVRSSTFSANSAASDGGSVGMVSRTATLLD